MSETERWLPVVGYPDYEVSDLGRVRSLRRRGRYPGTRAVPAVLSPSVNDNGYLRVTLRATSRPITRMVHRLVLEAFVGPCQAGMVARHFPDRDPSNDRLGNLQWGTREENEADKRAHGTDPSGSRHGRARLTESMIAEARRRHESGESFIHIGASLGVVESTIQRAVSGVSWRHLGPADDKRRSAGVD